MDQAQAQEQAQAPQTQGGANLEQLQAVEALDKLMSQGKHELRNQISPQQLARAETLARAITLDNTDELHSVTQKAMDEISNVSREMIGNTKIGEVDYIAKIFTDLDNMKGKLDVSKLHRDPGRYGRWIRKVIKSLDPLRKFLKELQSVQGTIESYRQQLLNGEADRITAIKFYERLKKTLFEAFEALEVAVAAAEIVLERERKAWTEWRAQLEQKGNPSPQELFALKDMRLKIVNLDNRLMRFQNTRMDVIIDLETINTALKAEEAVKMTLHDLARQAIPALLRNAAIGIQIYRLRKANQLGEDVSTMVDESQAANIAALGMAQEETHRSSMRAANRATTIADNMQKVLELVAQGVKNIAEEENANLKAREALAAAEKKFANGLEDELKNAAKL